MHAPIASVRVPVAQREFAVCLVAERHEALSGRRRTSFPLMLFMVADKAELGGTRPPDGWIDGRTVP